MTSAIVPITIIGTALLTDSTIPEPDATFSETAWNGATAYVVGDEAYYTDHIVYTRLVNGTTATAPNLDTVNWEPTRYTNRFAMFDNYRNTQSDYASPVSVELTPGQRINTIVAAGLTNVNTVLVTVDSGATQVYSHEEDMNSREVLDWYDYFFADFSTRSELVLYDLPPYTDAVITITFTATTGNVKIGHLSYGNHVFMGYAQHSGISRNINLSVFDRNVNTGSIEITPKPNIPIVELNIFADKNLTRTLYNLRDATAGVPIVVTGIDDDADQYFKPLFVIGTYRNFEIDIRHQEHTIINLSMEGM